MNEILGQPSTYIHRNTLKSEPGFLSDITQWCCQCHDYGDTFTDKTKLVFICAQKLKVFTKALS